MDEDRIIYGNPEPWLDLMFKTSEQRFVKTDSGSTFYSSALSTDTKFGAAGVGVDIRLNDWEAEPTSDPRIVFYHGDVRLRSLGDRTKNLIAEMSAKFPSAASGQGAPAEKLFVECVALNGDPANLETRQFVGKLSFGEPGDNNECQVFLTIDAARESGWFGEKDPDDSHKVLGWLARLS
ncbi:hypothetical protein NMG46_13275 [Mesorhizobium sp. LMG 17147]|uniref:hypothetical protein n=1 Tax=Mesorhizobium sp. LMG 17147 TaxID=2963091 RepID=UPI0020C9E413|nr:hypothetical protein [Mesorhizobium sp. LMG 17147]MCP9231215.1 hypothetical protein [Mesorhizobium sp. LMG 17147]